MKDFESRIKYFRVLVVEDEPLTRKLLGKALKRTFKNITLCKNGSEGLLSYTNNYKENEKFDLIITDIDMPVLGGLDMLKEIRKYDKNVPAIFLTAKLELDYVNKSINMSALGYLLKPFDFGTFHERITIMLEEAYDKE